MKNFEEFKNKEKFTEDMSLFYPGMADEILKPVLTELINLAAVDFEILAKGENASDKNYQDAIRKGLERFTSIKNEIDSEEIERICSYFEELMDIVELESSNGQLNKFRYGFDPSEI